MKCVLHFLESLTRAPLRRKTKQNPSRTCFLFQENPCPLEPLMSLVYKDIQSCFYGESRGLGTAASPETLLPPLGPSASSLMGLLEPSLHSPQHCPLEEAGERGSPFRAEGGGNFASMSPATKALPRAHWSQVGKIQEAVKPRKQQIWIPALRCPSDLETSLSLYVLICKMETKPPTSPGCCED